MVANCREKTVRSLGLIVWKAAPMSICASPVLTSLRSRTVKPLLRSVAATATLLSPSISPVACAPRESRAL